MVKCRGNVEGERGKMPPAERPSGRKAEWAKGYGCLAGAFVGDALGMPCEYLPAPAIRAYLGEVRGFLPAPDWHPAAGKKPGTVSDDTYQALKVSEILARDGSVTVPTMAQALLDLEAEKGPAMGWGPSARAALSRLARGENPFLTGLTGTTNGAAPRVLPLAIRFWGSPGELLRNAVSACIPTHATPAAVGGACAFAYAVAACLSAHLTMSEIKDAAMEGAQAGPRLLDEILEQQGVRGDPSARFSLLAGRVGADLTFRLAWAWDLSRKPSPVRERLHALVAMLGNGVPMTETIPYALGLFWVTDGDPCSSLAEAVNGGGDTDTIAFIVGALAGASHGPAAVPPEWVNHVQAVNGLDIASVVDSLFTTPGG